MAKVFVSHRRADAVTAERLAADLRLAGHSVWFDEWEIVPGDSIVDRMNQGLTSASYLVLCCSTAGVTSPWIAREWLSALARQLDGHGIKILPARLPGGALPPILADIKYADLATDWTTGLAELLQVIR